MCVWCRWRRTEKLKSQVIVVECCSKQVTLLINAALVVVLQRQLADVIRVSFVFYLGTPWVGR